MSREIDERIVEMRFDNQQFEKGVKTTLGSLDKLKKSLRLDDETSGFDKLQNVIDHLDFSKLISSSSFAIEKLMILHRHIDNIVQKAETMVKSLSIDQVTAGWSKYETKTSSVQTIMAATAKDFKDTNEQMKYVNAQLEKLNWYTDETSYNFTDMVNSIGKFTSNGVKLDRAVTAMQAIGNWAGISGAKTEEASRAMYNLSQAISVGAVKLIDWKSIENANMSTLEFKEQVIDTALALGTLKKAEDGTIYSNDDIEHVVSATNFNEYLKDNWFSSEVLLSVLDNYGKAVDKVHEYVEEADGDLLTSDLFKYLDSYKAGNRDFTEQAEEAGLSAERLTEMLAELSKAEYELSIRSFKAGQEAKTFTEALDAVKDAVSTGWMNTFETIFGDYEEAKKLWTNVANGLYDVFAEGGNRRNKVLKKWAEALDENNESGRKIFLKGIGHVLSWFTENLESIRKSFRKGFLGIASDKESDYVNIMGSRLFSFTKGFESFTAKLKPTTDTLEKFETIFTRVFRSIKNFTSPIITFGGAVYRGFSAVFEAVSPTLFKIADKLSYVIEVLSGAFARFMNTNIGKFASWLGGVFSNFVNWVAEAVSGLNDIKLPKWMQTIVDWGSELWDTIVLYSQGTDVEDPAKGVSFIFESLEEVKKKLSEEDVTLADAIWAVIRGDYGNDPEREANLAADGLERSVVQPGVNTIWSTLGQLKDGWEEAMAEYEKVVLKHGGPSAEVLEFGANQLAKTVSGNYFGVSETALKHAEAQKKQTRTFTEILSGWKDIISTKISEGFEPFLKGLGSFIAKAYIKIRELGTVLNEKLGIVLEWFIKKWNKYLPKIKNIAKKLKGEFGGLVRAFSFGITGGDEKTDLAYSMIGGIYEGIYKIGKLINEYGPKVKEVVMSLPEVFGYFKKGLLGEELTEADFESMSLLSKFDYKLGSGLNTLGTILKNSWPGIKEFDIKVLNKVKEIFGKIVSFINSPEMQASYATLTEKLKEIFGDPKELTIQSIIGKIPEVLSALREFFLGAGATMWEGLDGIKAKLIEVKDKFESIISSVYEFFSDILHKIAGFFGWDEVDQYEKDQIKLLGTQGNMMLKELGVYDMTEEAVSESVKGITSSLDYATKGATNFESQADTITTGILKIGEAAKQLTETGETTALVDAFNFFTEKTPGEYVSDITGNPLLGFLANSVAGNPKAAKNLIGGGSALGLITTFAGTDLDISSVAEGLSEFGVDVDPEKLETTINNLMTSFGAIQGATTEATDITNGIDTEGLVDAVTGFSTEIMTIPTVYDNKVIEGTTVEFKADVEQTSEDIETVGEVAIQGAKTIGEVWGKVSDETGISKLTVEDAVDGINAAYGSPDVKIERGPIEQNLHDFDKIVRAVINMVKLIAGARLAWNIARVAKGLGTTFQEIGTAIKGFNDNGFGGRPERFGDKVKKVIIGFIAAAAAVVLLGFVPADVFAAGVRRAAIIAIGLIAVGLAMSKISSNNWLYDTATNAGNSIMGIGIGILLAAIACEVLVDVVRRFGDMDIWTLFKGLGMLALTMLIVVRFAKLLGSGGGQSAGGGNLIKAIGSKIPLIGKFILNSGGGSSGDASNVGGILSSTAGSILSAAIAVRILVSAVAKLGEIDATALGQGLFAIAILLLEIAAFSRILGSNKEGFAGMIAAAVAIDLLVFSIVLLGNMPVENLKNGIIAVGALMIALVIVVNLLKKGDSTKAAWSFMIIAVAISLLLGALQLLSTLGVSFAMVRAVAALIAGIGAMVLTLTKTFKMIKKVKWNAGLKVGWHMTTFLISLLGGLLLIGALLFGVEAAIQNFGEWGWGEGPGGEAFKNFNIVDFLGKTLDALVNILLPAIGSIVDFLLKQLSPIIDALLDAVAVISEGLGEVVGAFAGGLVGAYESVKQSFEDDAMVNSAKAQKKFFEIMDSAPLPDENRMAQIKSCLLDLAEIQNAIPDARGFMDVLFGGGKSWSTIGNGLAELGGALASFSNSCTNVDAGTVGVGATAISSLVDAMKGLDEEGITLAKANMEAFISSDEITAYSSAGLEIGKIGGKSWDTIGRGLAGMGLSLKAFGEACNGMDKDAVSVGSGAVKDLADAMEKLPATPVKFSKWFGNENETSISLFGNKSWDSISDGLVNMATALKDFSEESKNIDEGGLGIGIGAVSQLTDLLNALPGEGDVSKFDFLVSKEGLAFAITKQEGSARSWEQVADHLVAMATAMARFSWASILIDKNQFTKGADCLDQLVNTFRKVPPSVGFFEDLLFGGKVEWGTIIENMSELAVALAQFSNPNYGGEVDYTEGMNRAKIAGAIVRGFGSISANKDSLIYKLLFTRAESSDKSLLLAVFGGALVSFSRSCTKINTTKVDEVINNVVTPLFNALTPFTEQFNNPNGQTTFSWISSVLDDINDIVTLLDGMDVEKLKYLTADLKILTTPDSMEPLEGTLGYIRGLVEEVDENFKDDNVGTGVKNFDTIIQDLIALVDSVKAEGIDGTLTRLQEGVTKISEIIGLAKEIHSDNKFSFGKKDVTNGPDSSFGTMISWFVNGALPKLSEEFTSEEAKAEYEESMEAFTTGLKTASESETNKKNVTDIGKNASTWIGEAIKDVELVEGDYHYKAVIAFITRLSIAFTNRKAFVSAIGIDITRWIAGGISNETDRIFNAGVDCINGLINGIRSRQFEVRNAALGVAAHITGPFQNALQIKSPSKVMADLGSYVVQGLANGINDESSSAENAALSLANSMRNVLARSSYMLTDDVSPTITPVVDMSNVASGARFINGMFGPELVGNVSMANARSIQMQKYLSAMEKQSTGPNLNNVIDAIGNLQNGLNELGEKVANMQLVMDTGALVGSISTPIDNSLQRRVVYNNRRL